MQRVNFPWILGLFVALAFSTASAEEKLIEHSPMGMVVTVPEGWKVVEAKDAPPSAVSESGLKLTVLFFDKLWLYEVTNPAKLAEHYAPALKDAKASNEEKAQINGLAGARMEGKGTLDGKPAPFKCVLIGDPDNNPRTLVVIVCGPEAAMEKEAKVVTAAVESVRRKAAKKE